MIKLKDNRLLINLAVSGISYGSTVLIAFFLTPYLIKHLGKEAYSFYPLANNFVSYMSIVTIALNSMASRFITIEIARGNTLRANEYFSSVLYANGILALILMAVMTFIVIFLNEILSIPVALVETVRILFALVFCSMLVNVLTSVFGVATFAKNRLDLRSAAEVFNGVLRIMLYVFLFSVMKPSIVFVGTVALILSISQAIMNYCLTKRLLPELSISSKHYKADTVRELIASGIWNSINQLGGLLISGMSLYISNRLVGVSASSEIAIAQIFPNFFNGIITLMTAVYLPKITYTYAQSSHDELVSQVQNAQNTIALVLDSVCGVFLAIAPIFFSLWVPLENASNLSCISFVLAGHLCICAASWPLFNLCIVLDCVKTPAICLVICGVVNIVASCLLAIYTEMGIYAICVPQLCVFVIWMGMVLPMYTSKVLKVSKKILLTPIIKSAIAGLIVWIIAKIGSMVINPNTWSGLILFCILFGIIGVVIAAFILFRPNNVYKYFLQALNKC